MKPDSITRSLRIEPIQGERLSEAQQAFNQKVQEIEALKVAIQAEREKQEAVRKAAVQHLIPAQGKITESQRHLARSLDHTALSLGFSARQQAEVGACIHALCEDILLLHPEDELARELSSRWEAAESTETERELDQEAIPEVEIDWDQLSQDPEALQAYLDKLESERMNEQSHEHAKQKRRKPRLSAPVQEQVKSVREVFVGLVKKLHPDTEQDPILRNQKEGLMKEVIVAYEQDDLVALLQLEADWVQQENSLGEIPEGRLSHLLELLLKQVADLQKEYSQVKQAFDGTWLEDFMRMKKEPAIQAIKQQAQWMQDYARELGVIAESFNGPDGKRYVQAFVKVY